MALTKLSRTVLFSRFLRSLPCRTLSETPDCPDECPPEPKNPCQEQLKKSAIQCTEDRSKALERKCPPEPQILTFQSEEDKERGRLQKCKVLIRGVDDYCLISGVPLEITCTRMARIYQPRKNAMQSGTRHIGHWEIDYETKQRWKNPLMGWCSSGDCLSNLKMRFATKEEALEYCKKNHMKCWVQESFTKKKFKVKSYGINFHHKNRTRVGTK